MSIVSAVLRNRHLVSREIISLTPAHQSVPQLVPLSGRYLAVWFETRGEGAVTRRAILDGAGNRLTPVVETDGRAIAVESIGESALILTTTDYAKAVATQLDGNGEVLSTSSITTTEAAVVWAGTHYLVAWSAYDVHRRESSMFTSIITTAGTTTLPRRVEVSNLAERMSNSSPVLAFDGNNVLMAWTTSVDPEWPVIGPHAATSVAVLLSPSGTALQTVPAVVVADEWAGRQSLASSGAEFLLVTADIRGGGKIRATTIVPAATGLSVEKSRDLFLTASPSRRRSAAR